MNDIDALRIPGGGRAVWLEHPVRDLSVDRDGLWELVPEGFWVLLRASEEWRTMMRRYYYGSFITWTMGASNGL